MNLSLKKKIFYLAIAAICLISISGAAIYYFYSLDWLGISLTLILSGFGVWFLGRMIFAKKKDSFGISDIAGKFIDKKARTNWKELAMSAAWLIPYLVFLIFLFYFLFIARTDNALTSPWQVVPAKFFLFYILATGYLFFLAIKKFPWTFWLIIAHYFLSFSVLWIVFKIGYGYDPFIHQATVQLIDKQGAVFPKTPYYLGQYVLVLLAHKLFFLPIVWADKLLLPILSVLTLPPTIYLFLRRYSQNLSSITYHLSLLILLILPFSLFTLTVPQNLAYLFLLLAILFALSAETREEIILSFLLSGAALVIHPIAGIPALLFAVAILINRQPSEGICFPAKNNKIADEICLDQPHEGILRIKTTLISDKKHWRVSIKSVIDFFSSKNIFYLIIALLTAGILPWLFYLSGKNSSTAAAGSAASAGFSIPGLVFPRQENIILNFTYFFINNECLLLIILTASAAYAVYRYRSEFSEFIILGMMAVGLLVAYFITLRLNFSFLISYERNDYAQRILFDALIFLIPVLAVLSTRFVSLILRAKAWLKYSWLALLAILITISLYGSYPRIDNYYNSRSFSVGADDLAAVSWIDQDSGKISYVVLADQQVSVGALWTFGFSHYFKSPLSSKAGSGGGSDQIYFYPIPTGGPLYQIYLDMVYQNADRTTAIKAATLTGAKNIYFVINKYWTNFDKIVEQAKIDAMTYQNIDNGQVYIFKYQN
jgi:hypothetical protein